MSLLRLFVILKGDLYILALLKMDKLREILLHNEWKNNDKLMLSIARQWTDLGGPEEELPEEIQQAWRNSVDYYFTISQFCCGSINQSGPRIDTYNVTFRNWHVAENMFALINNIFAAILNHMLEQVGKKDLVEISIMHNTFSMPVIIPLCRREEITVDRVLTEFEESDEEINVADVTIEQPLRFRLYCKYIF